MNRAGHKLFPYPRQVAHRAESFADDRRARHGRRRPSWTDYYHIWLCYILTFSMYIPVESCKFRSNVADTFYGLVRTAAIWCHIRDRAIRLDLYLRSP